MNFLLDFVFYTVLIGLFLAISGKIMAKHFSLTENISFWTFLKCGMFSSFVAVIAANIVPHFYS